MPRPLIPGDLFSLILAFPDQKASKGPEGDQKKGIWKDLRHQHLNFQFRNRKLRKGEDM